MIAVDVVIPAFNAANYVREAVDSVLAQSHAVSRVIVVDDASTDTTASVVAGFGAPVELLKRTVNGGCAAARNSGIAVSNAPLIAFLDADDRWLPGKLARQVDALSREAPAMFALSRVRIFASSELPPDERQSLEALNGTEFEGWTASALLARRQLFDEIGVYDEALRIGESVDWFSRARIAPFVLLDEVYVERRLHRSNTTRIFKHDHRDYLLAAKRHLVRQRANKSSG